MDLKELRDDRYKIDSLKERIMRLRSSMEIGARPVSGGSRAQKDRLAEKTALLLELEAQLMEKTAGVEAAIRAAEYEIGALPEQQRRIVRLRAVDCMSWKKVAQKVHYSQGHCKKIYAKAVENLRNPNG